MRTCIFNFDQKVLLSRGINLSEALVLDYLLVFFSSGNAKALNIDGKRFCWISYSKITQDLPILKPTPKKIQRMMLNLEKSGVIIRQQIKKQMYIHINELYLFYSEQDLNTPFNPAEPEEPSHKPALKFFKEKVKIIYKHSYIKHIVPSLFCTVLKQTAKEMLTSLQYALTVKNVVPINISDNCIVLKIPTTSILYYTCKHKFEDIIIKTFQKILPPDNNINSIT